MLCAFSRDFPSDAHGSVFGLEPSASSSFSNFRFLKLFASRAARTRAQSMVFVEMERVFVSRPIPVLIVRNFYVSTIALEMGTALSPAVSVTRVRLAHEID